MAERLPSSNGLASTCCAGDRSLEDTCHEAVVDPAVVIRALDELPPFTGGEDDVQERLDDPLYLGLRHPRIRASIRISSIGSSMP
jgi:hypothetical protein